MKECGGQKGWVDEQDSLRMPSLSLTLRKGTSLPLESFDHWYPLKLQFLSRFFAVKLVLESPDLPQSSAQVICGPLEPLRREPRSRTCDASVIS